MPDATDFFAGYKLRDGDAAGADAASEGGDQDMASIKTTTADLFPENDGAGAFADASIEMCKLGLDINARWGWDGSDYNDYE